MDAAAAQQLVGRFNRMVRRDGGELALLSVSDGEVRVGYRLGADPTCEDGACVLPHLELQELMGETVARLHPETRVIVEVTP